MGEIIPTSGKKQIILNAFVMNTPGHLAPGLWKHPRNKTDQYKSLSFWTDLAQLLDKAGFHAMFLADTLGAYDVYKGPSNVVPALASGAQFPVNDPLYLVPAMSAVTKNLIFGVTASVTYEKPYALARRLSTVDHLSQGRLAWNIVTSYLDSAARNHGLNEQIPHDERYAIADEYLEVLYKLWEGSFRDDAVLADRQLGTYIASDGVREINHKGKYFDVPGPHFCEPSPQRTPFLFQAGVSEAGGQFGGKHGEAIFIGGQTPEGTRMTVDNIRNIAKQQGRDPNHIKVIVGINVIVAATNEEAVAKREDYLQYADDEGALALFGGWTGIDLSNHADDEDFRFSDSPRVQSIVRRWSATVPGTDSLPWTKRRIVEYISVGGLQAKVVGSPTTVADELERWVEVSDVDGFNLAHIVNPGTFEDIIEFLLPELRRRGVFREEIEKEGATAREYQLDLLESHQIPYSKMKEAVVDKNTSVIIRDVDIPTPGHGQVLIRVVVSGTNPKDWKLPIWQPENVMNQGDDIAGYVEAVGEGVLNFRKGDKVAALHNLGSPHGSYAEYAIAWEYTTFHLTENTGFEEAATIPLAAMTAALGLYQELKLPLPWSPVDKPTPLVVYGAASAVGAFAIKFAQLSNIHPIIAVAGKGAPFVETLISREKGDTIVDYREGSDAIHAGIRAASNGVPIQHAYDAVSEKGSYETIGAALDKPGKITVVLPVKVDKAQEQISFHPTMVGSVHKPPAEGQVLGDKEFAAALFQFIGRGLAQEWFSGHPYDVRTGGLGGLEAALKDLKAGNASAVKYVVELAETAGVQQ
ncbi:Nitrilotriacetate monooxygenase component A/pristinamycin IIA synthase subunit A [Penicillium coprophilum]|uniref:Nitrilotriacetate monooxygenase component A/pristinamycin IIA synthase subunit A n=1 Tax=Penicillium coprophilum TaxID=36646 RepID=UPI00238E9784|nr:Nitrilotriacetate monooxygenase component A/pristinamycin IIA synthase subunit A [Penicillium coprophilum]KAJ5163874.1 Nitrilotriacetate monooxygenase component A/pristinamycin IIA synthase subunit A [Penicillium coprophilum]